MDNFQGIETSKQVEAKPYNLFGNLNQEEHFEASIIELIQFNTIIICVYRNPNSNINIFIETMDTIISNLINKEKSIIIVGDLNIDFLGRSVNLQLQQIILNKGLWGCNLKVIETGFSGT
jgi:exonuclease III